jgi:hypothetical protein
MPELERLERVLEASGDPGNPSAGEVRDVMETIRTIAVVGISRNPEKAARRVPAYLAAKGYDVIPVNPFVDQMLGREARESLDDVSEPVDMVLVFRPSEEAAEIARTALGRDEKPVIWLQEGIRADDVAKRAREEGVTVIQDLCAFKVHKALEE